MAAVIDPKVDFYLAGDWLPVLDVRQNPPIQITGGTKDEASSASPGKCKFTVNNDLGDWDPRNPMGAHFGELGKNTPCRVRVPLLTDSVAQTVTNGWGNTDTPGVVWENATSTGGTVAATDWSRSGTTRVHTLPAMNCTRRSWVSRATYLDCCVRDTVRYPMTTPTGASVYSYIELRVVDVNNRIRVAFRAATGGQLCISIVEVIAGVTRTLLTDTAIDGMELNLARQTYKTVAMVEGQVVRAKLWWGGDPEPKDWQVETTRASVRPGKVGIASVTGNGNTNSYPMVWEHTDFSVEARPFTGENSEYNPRVSDESHAAPYVQIVASGITQRTTQGGEPLKSALTRYWTSDRRWVRNGSALANLDAPNNNTFRTTDAEAADLAAVGGFFRLSRPSNGQILNFFTILEDQMFTITNKASSGGNTTVTFTPDALVPVKSGDSMVSYEFADATDAPIAYWPCEDGKGATQAASGVPGGQPMTASNAVPKFGEFEPTVGSAPIMKLNDAELNGSVADYVDTNQAFTFFCLFQYPPLGGSEIVNQALVQLWTDSSVAEVWAFSLNSSGSNLVMDVRAFDVGGSGQLFLHSPSFSATIGHPTLMVFTAYHTAPTTVEYKLDYYWYGPDGTTNAGGFAPVTATGVTNLGKLKKVQINPGGGYVETAIGHIGAVGAKLDASNLRDAPGGNVGEAPARRLRRLSYEENVPLTYCQGPFSTSFLGPQQEDTLVSNFKDAANFDLGRLYESRGSYSFEYRARSSLYNQAYFLDVDYTAGGVLDVDAADDDQGTRNDITVKQIDGSSFRAVDTTSPMSVLPPGEGGVGRYTEAPEVSVLSPVQLPDLAHWRLALGTVNEERYKSIKLTPVDGNVTLEQMFSAGVGNRYRVTNLHARHIYHDVDQLVNGYTLVLHPYVPTLELNGTPSSPYNVAALDAAASRLGSGATETTEPLDTTETSITIHSTDSVTPFINSTDHASRFPVNIVIGGEVMTLTACTSPSGGDLAQTMTVTRSVNGVVKEHSTGAAVELAALVRIPL